MSQDSFRQELMQPDWLRTERKIQAQICSRCPGRSFWWNALSFLKVFFLIINCLSAALTAHPVCPSEADANWNLQGHIRISILCLISAGNRRKFTSVFNCASLAHPCASVAGYRRNSKSPCADSDNASVLRRTDGARCQTLERLF